MRQEQRKRRCPQEQRRPPCQDLHRVPSRALGRRLPSSTSGRPVERRPPSGRARRPAAGSPRLVATSPSATHDPAMWLIDSTAVKHAAAASKSRSAASMRSSPRWALPMTRRAFPSSCRYSARPPNSSIARFALSIAPSGSPRVQACGGQRGGRERRVDPVVLLDRDPERLAQERHRLLGPAGDGVQLAEVIQELPDVLVVGDALEERLRPLGIVARAGVLVAALGDERGVEIGLGEDAVVVEARGRARAPAAHPRRPR